MMRRNDKSWAELDEMLEPFLPEESAEAASAVAIELRTRLVKLEQQVMSQYTSMAAYATISKQDFQEAKAEGRADLDRSQATLIGLLEKLRNEVNTRLDSLERRAFSGDLTPDAGSRLGSVEQQLAETTTILQQCLAENRELRAHVAELVGQRMQEDGWLVSSGSSENLSMR
jgi:hypothetical protein